VKRSYLFLVVFVLFFGCDKNALDNPEGASLIFPLENSECTTGISVSETLSQVTFEWEASENTDLYVLSAVNLNTNTPQTITTAATSASLSIEKGAPYSWTITSSNSDSDITAISENWLFYNAGPQVNYAPFPAQLVFPVSGSTIQADGNSQTFLSWEGADVEDDIAAFEVYFSETNPPLDLIETIDGGIMEVPVVINSGARYYWRIITTDTNGNTSDSGVQDFKVL